MARPSRPQFAGAEYHVTTRGVRGAWLFADDVDRIVFLGMLENGVKKFGWRCRAYCLMFSHFHLVVATPDPSLGAGMQWLLGYYVGWFNYRHGTVGHLVERRYRAKVVDSDDYRLSVTGYVFRNPIEAQLCGAAEEWPWSSYAATVGLAFEPDFLEPGWILDQFGHGREAIRRLRAFVSFKPVGSDPDGIR